MKTAISRQLSAVSSFLLLIVLTSSAVPGQSLPQPNSIPKGILFQGTSYTAYVGNDKFWEFRADHIQGNQKRAKATNVRGTLYRKGKPHYTLRSKVAYINPATSDIFFPDGAQFQSTVGEMVDVRLLLWKAREKKFVGTKGVRVEHLNTRLQGDRMVLDQDSDRIKLFGHVKAQVIP